MSQENNKSRPSLDSQILLAAQSGDRKAGDHLASHFGGIEPLCGHKNGGGLMRTLAWRALSSYGLENHHDILQDVVAEAYCEILRPDIQKYDPEKCTPVQYINGIVRNGAKKMVRMFSNNSVNHIDYHGVAEDVDGHTKCYECLARYEVEEPAAYLIREENSMQLRTTLNHILAHAVPEVREAIRRRYYDDESTTEISLRMGVERTALAHRVRRFINRHRAMFEEICMGYDN